MRLVGEAASQGQAAPAGEVFGTVGGEQRLESDDAGEGLRWEADGREKAAVKLAEAEQICATGPASPIGRSLHRR